MRVAIDARAAVRPELGGVERWARELCARLPYDGAGAAAGARAPRRARVGAVRAAGAERPGAASCCARRTSRRWPRATSSWSSTTPRRCAIPAGTRASTPPGSAALLPLIARRARRVITVSPFSRDELRELLGVDADGRLRRRRRALPPGAAPARRERARTCSASPRTPPARTSRRSSPPRTALARDGIELRRRRRPPPAVRGRGRPRRASSCSATSPTTSCPASTRAPRPSCCRRLYEGFGLPVLEAMASGTPVVAADTTALPDTCGGAARLTEPEPEAMREALTAAARRRRRAGAAARARASSAPARFTWERTAREVDAIVRTPR